MTDIVTIALGAAVGLYIFAISLVVICTVIAETLSLAERIKRWRLKRQIRKGTSQISVKAAPSDEGLDKLDILV
ncbi:MAG: hypothetical protein ACTSUS_07900 [Candidatus Freyarchaeota archaeon]